MVRNSTVQVQGALLPVILFIKLGKWQLRIDAKPCYFCRYRLIRHSFNVLFQTRGNAGRQTEIKPDSKGRNGIITKSWYPFEEFESN